MTPPVNGPAASATQPQQTHVPTDTASPTLPAGNEVPQPVPQPTTATQATEADRTDDAPQPTDAREDADGSREEAVSIPDPLSDLDSAEAQFPLVLGDGALQLEIPFSFDGINPDAGGHEARNIAAIPLTNLSGHHLVDAELILVTRDGGQIRFRGGHIPPGRRVILFSTENLELPPQDRWERVYYRTSYTTAENLLGGSLDVLVMGTQIKLTNTTGASIPPFVLYCHDFLGEEYFGGKVYPYQVSEITAGQSVIINASDSLLGMVDAVYAGQITE